jgi:hypothetical protein
VASRLGTICSVGAVAPRLLVDEGSASLVGDEEDLFMSSEPLPEPETTPDRESGITLRGADEPSDRPSSPPASARADAPAPLDRASVEATFMRLGLALARVRTELGSAASPGRRRELFTAATTVLDAMDQVQELAGHILSDLMMTISMEPGVDLSKTSKALGKSLRAMKSGIVKQRAALRALQPASPQPPRSLKRA